jgi:predicted NBD/HSP70 family sugar kinase
LTEGEHWGAFSIVDALNRRTGLSWQLENDAAAAVRAEAWQGESRSVSNHITLTLGTGLGVGVWLNGKLLRSGRFLHPEAGHIIIEYKEKEVLCGCGNYGCAEAYLSGVNFSRWVSERWGESLNGEDLVARARAGDQKAKTEFEGYARRLAVYLSSLVVLFCPERVVLSGGFSHSADLFLPQTQVELEKLLSTRREGVDLLPTLAVSKFQDEAGVLGAAQLAFQGSH